MLLWTLLYLIMSGWIELINQSTIVLKKVAKTLNALDNFIEVRFDRNKNKKIFQRLRLPFYLGVAVKRLIKTGFSTLCLCFSFMHSTYPCLKIFLTFSFNAKYLNGLLTEISIDSTYNLILIFVIHHGSVEKLTEQ